MDDLDERSSRPLIVTRDELLLDELLRLAAAAGTVPQVVADVGSARRCWADAGLVVTGDDLAGALADLRPARRDGVVLVSAHPPAPETWSAAVAVGASEVLTLPAAQGALIDLFGDCLEGSAVLGGAVAVVGGCGGGGATTFAVGLAMSSAARSRRTMLVDADPLGGGLDLVLGAEHEPGVRWPEVAGTSGRLSAPALRGALPHHDGLAMLSWDRGDPVPVGPAAMRSVLAAAQRGHELVVLDLPRHLDPAAQEAVQRCGLTLVVVPAQVRAVAAASRVLAGLRELAPRMGLVVRLDGATGLDAEQVADTLAVEPWTSMRADRGVARALDEGLGPLRRRRGPLATGCGEVLDRLAAVGA